MCDIDRLAAATENILAEAIAATHPFSQVATMIARLRANTDCTDEDVREVQARVIRALIARAAGEPPCFIPIARAVWKE